MFCPQCGRQETENTRFCANCGAYIGQGQQPYVQKAGGGLSENVASSLCYLFGYITGVVFFVAYPSNKTIRFHALQSSFFALTLFPSVILGQVLAFLSLNDVINLDYPWYFVPMFTYNSLFLVLNANF